MIRGRCPICKKEFQGVTLAAMPAFPFCSERCRLVDLGRWIDGDYALPGPPVPPSGDGKAPVDDEDE